MNSIPSRHPLSIASRILSWSRYRWDSHDLNDPSLLRIYRQDLQEAALEIQHLQDRVTKLRSK